MHDDHTQFGVPMRVQVITSSRHGSTAEVGEAIARRLEERGLVATTHDAESVENISADAAVVIGSPVYMGKWLKPARAVLDRLGAEAAGRPVFVFSVGPVGDPPAPDDSSPELEVEAFIRDRATSSRLFAGRLDSTKLGWFERLAIKAVKAPDGDYRDWTAINAWADTIAVELSNLAPRPRVPADV